MKNIDGKESNTARVNMATDFHKFKDTLFNKKITSQRKRNSFLIFSEISKHAWTSVTFSKVAGFSFGDSPQNGKIKYENSVVKPVSILKISLLIAFVSRVLSKFV